MKYLINLLLLLCASCEGFDEASRRDRLCNNAVDEYAAKLLKKRGMQIVGSGGGADEGRCTLLSLRFKMKERINVNQARRLIVSGILELLNTLNCNDNAQEFLIEVPFTAARLDYGIASVDQSGATIRFDNIDERGDELSYVFLVRKRIYYEKFRNGYKPAWTIHEETFEEALAILKAEGYDPYPKKCEK